MMRPDNYTLTILNDQMKPGMSKKGEKDLARKHNPNPFDAGQRVAFKREFLKHAGIQPDGWAWNAKGVVDRIDGMLCVINWDDAPQQAVGSSSLMLERKVR